MGLSLVGKGDAAPSLDDRVRMVREVLAGRELTVVAAEGATPPKLLERWVTQFTAAGGRALAAKDVADESTADHLLAIVAHEIRSPLTSAAIALKLLSSDRLAQEQRVEAAESAARQLDLLSQLADDVLDGASVALGRMELKLEAFDLRRLVASVANESASERLGLQPGPPMMIVGDPNRLRQVMSNILRNALRHGIDDVDIAVERHQGYGTVTVVNHAREAVTQDDANRWFEPFARGSSRTGHGLGLYVVRALTVAHAGTVGVDSLACEVCPAGQDLRVWLRLPVSGPPPADDRQGHRWSPSITPSIPTQPTRH